MDRAVARMDTPQTYWAGLAAPTRKALLAAGSRTFIEPGAVVRMGGVVPGEVLVIRSGLVKITARTGGNTVVLALRGAGDIIGEIGYVTGDPGSALLVAIGPVEALRVPRCRFKAVLLHHPDAADTLYRTLADRLREADRDRMAAASMNVGQRLARLLLKIVARYDPPVPGQGLIIEGLSQSELAACIGSAPRTVARQIGAWRERGIVSTNRRSVLVHQPEALRRIAGLHAPHP